MNQETAAAEPKPVDGAYIALLIVAVLACLALPFLLPAKEADGGASGQPFSYGFAFGYHLFPFLVVLAVFHYTVGRDRRQALQIGTGVVLVVALIAGVVSKAHLDEKREDQRRFAESLRDQVADIAPGKEDANGVPQKIDKRFTATPGLHGDMAVADKFVKDFLNRTIAQRNAYHQAMVDLGWGQVLDANRIGQDRDLAQSKEMLRKAHELVEKNRAASFALFDNVPAEIRKLDMSESERAGMERGFMESMNQSRGRLAELFDLEARTVVEFDKIFALLERSKRTWVVQNGSIVFSRQADLDEFRRYLAAVEQLSARQDALQRQGMAQSSASLEKLKR